MNFYTTSPCSKDFIVGLVAVVETFVIVFDREQRLKVLKEALLLFFFLLLLEAWNHEQKRLQKEQKKFAMKIASN